MIDGWNGWRFDPLRKQRVGGTAAIYPCSMQRGVRIARKFDSPGDRPGTQVMIRLAFAVKFSMLQADTNGGA